MKTVYLYSGGLDSAIMVAQAWDEHRKGDTIELLYVRTTAPYARWEERKAKRLLHYYGIRFPFRIVDARPHPRRNSDQIPGTSFASAFVPARNLSFASLAVSYLGADIVRMAGVRDDRHIDSTADAYRQMSSVLTDLAGKPVSVEGPLSELTKMEAVTKFLDNENKAKRTTLLLYTYSCYKGGRRPCGKCPACRKRAKVLEIVKKNNILCTM